MSDHVYMLLQTERRGFRNGAIVGASAMLGAVSFVFGVLMFVLRGAP